jgi:hypothetical protein
MDKKKGMAAAAGGLAGLVGARAFDLALIGGSVATATGAVAFAGYMTLSGNHTPLVKGMKYLAIFAQPSHPHHAEDGDDGGPDMTPIGAIPPGKAEVEGYQLVGAEPRFAWLREGARIFAVHPGEDVPRLGRIGRIEQRDGRWALLDDSGKTLIVSTLPDLAPSAGGHFDKRMIFGNDN